MSLLKILEDVPDVRRAQGQRYKLNYLLLCSILSILCGARSYRDIHRFIKIQLKKLNELLGMNWKRAPAHSTLQATLADVKKPALEWCFRQHSQALNTQQPTDKKSFFVAVDGKSLRGSFDHSNDKGMLNLISAYCSTHALILGHIETDSKSNEIPAVQQLLNGFGLQGCVYTLDAMHCQKKRSTLLFPKKTKPLCKSKRITKSFFIASKN